MKEQSAIEMITTYSWAILIIAIVIAIILILIGFKPPSDYLQSECNIDPLLPCVDTLLVYNSTGPMEYTIIFKNDLGRSINISSNGFNLTTTNIGRSTGTNNYLGNCTPEYVTSGGEVMCRVNITGPVKAAVGTSTTTPFNFEYKICSSSSKCGDTVYKTTGYSTQIVAPTGISFLELNFQTYPNIGSISVNGVPYASGTTQFFIKGEYSLFASPPSGYVFYSSNPGWKSSPSSLKIGNPYNQSTNLTIENSGTIYAYYTLPSNIPPPPPKDERYLNMSTFPSTAAKTLTPGAGHDLENYKSSLTISEVNNTGYKFENWTGHGTINYTGTSTSGTVQMYTDIDEQANYDVYLTELASPSTADSSLSPGSGWYVPGSYITLSEVNNTGYKFENWTGYEDSTLSKLQMQVPGQPFTEQANYDVYLNELSYPPSGVKAGTLLQGSGWYDPTSSINISEQTNSGFQFINWTGYEKSTSASFTMTVPSVPFTEQANYYSCLIEVSNPTGGAKSLLPGSGCTYTDGDTITISETNNTGYEFINWTGYEKSTSASFQLVVPGKGFNETANYDVYLTELASPSTADYSLSPGSGWYLPNSSITLSEVNNTGYKFENWTGYEKNSSSSFTMTVPSVPFTEQANYDVYLNELSSPEGGALSLLPGSGWYDPTSSITLSESPNSGYEFINWTGYEKSTSASFTMTVPSVPFTETALYYIYLKVYVNPVGDGTASDAGNLTTNNESNAYPYGTTVNINANAYTKYGFSDWAGVGTGSYTGETNKTSVIIESPIIETANFYTLQSCNNYILSTSDYPTTVHGECYWTGGDLSLYTGGGDSDYSHVYVNGSNGANYLEESGTSTYLQYNTMNSLPLQNYYLSLTDGSGGGSGGNATAKLNNTAPFTLKVHSENSGTATASPGGSTSTIATYYEPDGDSIPISEVENSGYSFTEWTGTGSGSYTGASTSASVTIDSNVTEVANYNVILTLNVNPSGDGTATASPGGSTTSSGAYSVASGDSISLSEDNNTVGYEFVNWTCSGINCYSGTSTSPSFTIGGPTTETANFKLIPETLTIESYPSVGGSTGPSTGTYTYNYGTQVPLSESSNSGYEFTSWTGTGSASYTGTDPSPTITMTSKVTEQANFGVYLTTNTYPSSGGSVSPNSGYYAYDSQVTITESSNPGYTFTGWTCNGDGCSSADSSSITVTMGNPITETANYGIGLTMSISDSNAGSISPSSGSYQELYGSQVTISESTNSGYEFTGWTCSGTNCYGGTDSSYTLTMDNPMTEQANFDVCLTMGVSSGSGSVSPGSECVPYGTNVGISASPSTGYEFTGWTCSGTNCYDGTDSSYTLTMDNPMTEDANFKLIPESFTISTNPSAGGSITNPSGGSGTYTYSYGSTVSFSESPSSGYSFTSWTCTGNDCYGGTDSSATITITGSVTETALYDVCLTMAISPSSSAGSISPGAGTYCDYSTGQGVSISESTGLGYEFTGWSGSGTGSYSGSATSTTIYMDGPITETADYESIPDCNGYSYSTGAYQTSYTGECYWTGGNLNEWVAGGNSGAAHGTLVGLSNGDTYFGQGTNGRCYTFIGIDNLPEQNYEVEFGDGAGGGSCGNAGVEFNTVAPLTVSASGSGSVSPSGTNDYQDGSSPGISESAGYGYYFAGWSCSNINGSGCYSGYNNPAYPTINGNIRETAHFNPNPESDYIYVNKGTGSVSPSGTIGENYGSNVKISATPGGRCGFLDLYAWHFSGWTGSYSSSSNPYTFTQPDYGISEGANFVCN